jgi:dipeptidyl-peptidase III
MSVPASSQLDTRRYLLERVDEAAVVQLYADGFTALPLREKILIYHLYQAALAGRDIYYDQRYVHNLAMRGVLEEIVTHDEGIPEDTLAEIRRYTKLFWINSGPYNNLTARKFVLKCTPAAFMEAVGIAVKNGARMPEDPAALQPYFFDLDVDPIVTSKSPRAGMDILQASANNLYSGVSMADLEGFEERYPLNSRLVRQDGRLVEEVYRVGGRYDTYIREIVRHLEAATAFATDPMAVALRALIRFYETGETEDRTAYDIAWVQDRESPVDTINGFVEVYMDARGMKGAWEALVYYVNPHKTAGIRKLAAAAQWFEDRMPWADEYKKQGVRGVSANAIDVVIETGDSGPVTPVGINLPNDQTIREHHGSKSVSLSNANQAYDKSTLPEFRREFAWSAEEAERAEKWSSVAGELTTDMHEVIGHGSGRIAEHLQGNPQGVLKEQYSALEESRADLVALYFVPDRKLVELGLVEEADHAEIVRAEYESYARNALVQLRRVREGSQIEEDHMRNRQMIVGWLMANSHAIELKRRDGKTYYVVVDVKAFQEAAGRLLADVQRIKAEGDYEAAKALFETYGVHFDPALRDEVVERVDRLKMPSYTGFVQPRLEAVRDGRGEITDVQISYPLDLTTQMLEYSGRLPRRSSEGAETGR